MTISSSQSSQQSSALIRLYNWFPHKAGITILLSGPSQHVPPEPVCGVPEELGPVPAAAGDGAEVHSQPAAGPVPAGAPATDPQSPHVRLVNVRRMPENGMGI